MKVLKRFKSRDGFSTLELVEYLPDFVIREMRKGWTRVSERTYVTRQVAEDRLTHWLTNAINDGISYRQTV